MALRAVSRSPTEGYIQHELRDEQPGSYMIACRCTNDEQFSVNYSRFSLNFRHDFQKGDFQVRSVLICRMAESRRSLWIVFDSCAFSKLYFFNGGGVHNYFSIDKLFSVKPWIFSVDFPWFMSSLYSVFMICWKCLCPKYVLTSLLSLFLHFALNPACAQTLLVFIFSVVLGHILYFFLL